MGDDWCCLICGDDKGDEYEVKLEDGVFLIRILLEIGRDEVGELEGDEQWWNTCGDCGDKVKNARQAYQQMYELLRKFKMCQKMIIELVKKLGEGKRGNGGMTAKKAEKCRAVVYQSKINYLEELIATVVIISN